MKKQLIILIVAVLLLVVGLCGCNNLSGTVSLKEIKEHPNKYLNQTISVEGYYSGGLIMSTTSPQSESEAMEAVTTALAIENNQNSITLYEGGKYRFTGILSEKTLFWNPYIYLNVTKVEAL